MNFINSLLCGANLLKLNFQMNRQRNPTLCEDQPEKEQIANTIIQQSLLQNYILTQSLLQQTAAQPVQPKSKKISKRTNECGHKDKEHYAKGMCNNCYHKFGRTKKPWVCGHDKLYAQGMCQNCYINKYNQKRREQFDEQLQPNAENN